eukprot:gnl/TRDRNA2_/TRDRNA2_135383_c0_seq1.p1 gnl/TRDRNA2_/TRDRNA2_135383_c0~~gnl/TRDRNA2_/TRDRNA2_135383_c0_seq1.p1  ORF type:complete len:221 (-),score=48.05 gnl/TRDRNA2_/TRDRNA2_135383_c0_seq1:383-979(-)
MGALISKQAHSAAQAVEDEVKAAVVISKLADVKLKKVERDTQIAMRIAVLRDRVHWLLAFYGTMLVVNAVRVKKLGIVDKRLAIGSFEPMPLTYFPYVATPFLFAYQADFAYGSKAERLNIETQNILRNEKHWFNEPMLLPMYMEPHYKKMMDERNAKLAERGLPPEEDWAKFSSDISAEDLLNRSSPISRLLHGCLI